jgi:hypothetical protein
VAGRFLIVVEFVPFVFNLTVGRRR